MTSWLLCWLVLLRNIAVTVLASTTMHCASTARNLVLFSPGLVSSSFPVSLRRRGFCCSCWGLNPGSCAFEALYHQATATTTTLQRFYFVFRQGLTLHPRLVSTCDNPDASASQMLGWETRTTMCSIPVSIPTEMIFEARSQCNPS